MMARATTMGERLTMARKAAGYKTRAEAINRFDWVATTYAAHENGQNKFNAEQAAMYGRAYNVSASWLLLGIYDQEPRHIPSEEIAASLDKEPEEFAPLSRSAPYRGKITGAFPEIVAKFGMGPKTDEGESQMIQLRSGATVMGHKVTGEWLFPRDYMNHVLRASPQEVFVVQVDGDSMAPVLLPGDRVVVDRSHTRINPDGLYAIDFGNGPQVKRVEVVTPLNDPMQLRIISENKSHTTSIVPADSITIVGRVCARITRM